MLKIYIKNNLQLFCTNQKDRKIHTTQKKKAKDPINDIIPFFLTQVESKKQEDLKEIQTLFDNSIEQIKKHFKQLDENLHEIIEKDNIKEYNALKISDRCRETEAYGMMIKECYDDYKQQYALSNLCERLDHIKKRYIKKRSLKLLAQESNAIYENIEKIFKQCTDSLRETSNKYLCETPEKFSTSYDDNEKLFLNCLAKKFKTMGILYKHKLSPKSLLLMCLECGRFYGEQQKINYQLIEDINELLEKKSLLPRKKTLKKYKVSILGLARSKQKHWPIKLTEIYKNKYIDFVKENYNKLVHSNDYRFTKENISQEKVLQNIVKIFSTTSRPTLAYIEPFLIMEYIGIKCYSNIQKEKTELLGGEVSTITSKLKLGSIKKDRDINKFIENCFDVVKFRSKEMFSKNINSKTQDIEEYYNKQKNYLKYHVRWEMINFLEEFYNLPEERARDEKDIIDVKINDTQIEATLYTDSLLKSTYDILMLINEELKPSFELKTDDILDHFSAQLENYSEQQQNKLKTQLEKVYEKNISNLLNILENLEKHFHDQFDALDYAFDQDDLLGD